MFLIILLLDLKLIIDLIPNHSSYKCEWFDKSIKQEGKYKDYYIWRNASNQNEVLSNSSITPTPPNNWVKYNIRSNFLLAFIIFQKVTNKKHLTLHVFHAYSYIIVT